MLLPLLLALVPQAVDVTSTPFPNDLTGPVGCASFEAGYILKGPRGFGGISAMRIGTGDAAYLVSDVGETYTGRALRNEDGFVSGFTGLVKRPITDWEGTPKGKDKGDAESLAFAADGGVYIGIEGRDKISWVRPEDEVWRAGDAIHKDYRKQLGGNSGFEALESLSDGRLIAISEGKDDAGNAIVIFFTKVDGEWTAEETTYHPASDFSVTDASVDPATGDLFVLERAFSRLRGPRARLARVAAPDLFIGDTIEGEEIFRLSALDGVDNMEGLMIERRDGRLLAHMISDDNFNPLQKTVLMGFEVEDECSAAAIAGD